ncbi:MAG: GtrA family protein [Ruminococcus sp.]|nr:GtrA family protein [Ruminococcus sp.]
MSRTKQLNISHKPNSTAAQFIRYVFVGGGAAFVQLGLLVLLKEGFEIDANIANAVGFVGGLVFNYIISTLWVFDNSTVMDKAVEFISFALIGLVGLGINQGMIWLFDKALSDIALFGGLIPADKYYLIGQIVATGIAFFWNFFARKYLLYNKKEE